MGLDVAPLRGCTLQLPAQLVHKDVDRAIVASHLIAPQAFVDALARQDLRAGSGEQLDQLVLTTSQPQAHTLDKSLELIRTNLHLANGDGVEVAFFRSPAMMSYRFD